MLNEIRIVDPRGAPLDAGEEGEIVARGPGVMDGYVDDPELNARAFVDGWFRTGDAGRLDEDGYLTITGRIKELINRGGEKIAPNEVERVIAGHPAVDSVCVFGISASDARRGSCCGRRAGARCRRRRAVDHRIRQFSAR